MQTMTSKRSAKSAKQPLSCFKIIRTAQDHKSAMERILVLMHLDPPRGTPEFDEMEVLGLLIEKYEEVHFPMNDADPIDMIKFMMDQQGSDPLHRLCIKGNGSAERHAQLELEHDSQAE